VTWLAGFGHIGQGGIQGGRGGGGARVVVVAVVAAAAAAIAAAAAAHTADQVFQAQPFWAPVCDPTNPVDLDLGRLLENPCQNDGVDGWGWEVEERQGRV
jgi:hypothetical protein